MTYAKAYLAVLLLILSGCASTSFDVGRTETVLPLNRAWVDGRQVEYVTTDISDLTMAKMAGVNYVPRLRDAITKQGQPSLVERVYKFPHGEQISIFQSAPLPAGGDNTDLSYSPLWRLVLVTWRSPNQAHELKSEEALLAAESNGEVTLKVTDIVVNCPITRSADGLSIKGAR